MCSPQREPDELSEDSFEEELEASPLLPPGVMENGVPFVTEGEGGGGQLMRRERLSALRTPPAPPAAASRPAPPSPRSAT